MASPYNLFNIGQQSKSPNLTAAHRLNIYYDVQVEGDKTQVAAYGTPGLNLFNNLGAQVTRGMHWMESNNMLYVVQAGSLLEVASSGSFVSRGLMAITDITGRVSIANNGTQLCIVTGSRAYIFNTSSNVFTDITATLPYPADTVTFLTGRFIVNRTGTGQFFVSALYNGLSWAALDFATAESSPDNLSAVIADKGMLVLFGTSSTEIWSPFADVAFPYTRVNAAPSDGGLAARWSLSRCAGNLTGLFRNRQGALAVCRLDGYTLTPISNADIDYLFNNYTSPSDAVGFGYTLNGRAFYQITFQAAQKSWLYDAATGAWSQLKSWNIPRHTGDLGAAFDTRFIVSDYTTGQLYTYSADAITDNGTPIEREITGTHAFTAGRNMLTIRRLRIDIEGGTGLIDGRNPQAVLTISRDGGHTWGRDLNTNMGVMASYLTRAEWRKLGQARDWVFKLRITDPVKVVIIGAVIEAQELGA